MESPIVAQRTLRDVREPNGADDRNLYTIAKLADCKCWMTQSLKLTGPKTLTTSDSDISANWTLPEPDSVAQGSCVNKTYHAFSGMWIYGYYYNWYAATAGSGTCTMTSGSATSSICPKGWHLPDSYGDVFNKYNTSAGARAIPATFQLSGTPFGEWGQVGYYWTNRANSADIAIYSGINSSGVYPSLADVGKYYGRNVRCVAR